jgi:hypothetical protein
MNSVRVTVILHISCGVRSIIQGVPQKSFSFSMQMGENTFSQNSRPFREVLPHGQIARLGFPRQSVHW